MFSLALKIVIYCFATCIIGTVGFYLVLFPVAYILDVINCKPAAKL